MTCAWKITQYGWTQHTLQIILYICFVSLATVEPPKSMPILVATPGNMISKYLNTKHHLHITSSWHMCLSFLGVSYTYPLAICYIAIENG